MATPALLSPRETEVLRLVAGGRTNGQIAEALVISPATAARHVHNILTKLGCTNRTEAAAFAARLGATAATPSRTSTPHSARGVFVGREKELARLRKAFDQALAGHGGLVMLAGEPGIGKTRTTQELETYAKVCGARVLWGPSHEDSGAPPYWPWVQVGRQRGAANDPAAFPLATASTRGELVRLFPELRDTPGFVEPEPVNEPQSAQFRLFDAYAAYLSAVAAREPLLVILDDLHWADKPTLQLLQHVARELPRLRILVVGAYRDTDLDRTHPLSEALAELNRDPGFDRIVLTGLKREEADAYVRATVHVEPSAAVLERVFTGTEGNPFFLTELVNLLSDEGLLTKDSLSELAVPAGVKEALGRRLNRLSPGTNELLQVAAVAGREFAYDTLRLLGGDRDAVLHRLEEAVGARVIEEMGQADHYRFTHALMQETILGELTATGRARLHGQVGEALEKRWGARAAQHASRLAHHFLESGRLTPAHAEKARKYALIAGREADRQFAWAEAVRWYEAATDGVDDPDPDVLLALARCGLGASGTSAAESWRSGARLQRAFDAYRRRGNRLGFARAVASAPPMTAMIYPGLFLEAIENAAEGDDELNATLRLKLRAGLQLAKGPDATADGQEQLEAELSTLADSPKVPDAAAIRAYLGVWAAGRRADPLAASGFYSEAANTYLRLGRLADAYDALLEASNTANVAGALQIAGRKVEALRAFSAAGRIATGLEMAGYLAAALARLRLSSGPAQLADTSDLFISGPLWELIAGRPERAVPRFKPTAGVPRPMLVRESALQAAVLLHTAGAAAALPDFLTWQELWLQGTARGWLAESFCYTAFFVLEMGDDDFWRQVWEEVRRWKLRSGPWSGLGVDPGRGLVALRLGLVDEARQAFEDGLAWAEREGCPVEAGRNLQGLAAVAERLGDLPAALACLDRAAVPFERYGTKFYLNQVTAKRAELQGCL